MNKIAFLFKLTSDILTNFFTTKRIVLISEGSDWVIDEEGKNIKKFIEKQFKIGVKISITPAGLSNKLIHFLSVNTFLDKDGPRNRSILHNLNKSNKVVLTWFHLDETNDPKKKFIPLLNTMTDRVITASTLTKSKLIKNGLNGKKVKLVPLGVDTDIFKPISSEERNIIRKKLGLPNNKIIIGSFQKDGNGWGEGLTPKLIKGPDIFCDVVEKLAKNYPIHVLLTGPARGYVKKRLSDSQIKYTHKYLDKYSDIVPYYQALDLYLICSREEGGPKALLEAMATGIPLVSTPVGMVPDIIEDGINGMMSKELDPEIICKKADMILKNPGTKNEISASALKKIESYDSAVLSGATYNIYKKLF